MSEQLDFFNAVDNTKRVEDVLLKQKVVAGRPTKPAKNDKVIEQLSFYPPQMCKS